MTEYKNDSHPPPDDDDDYHEVVSADQRRATIAVHYIDVLEAPPREERAVRDGTITVIMRKLQIPEGSRNVVVRVLNDVEECHAQQTEYSPLRKPDKGRPLNFILPGSL